MIPFRQWLATVLRWKCSRAATAVDGHHACAVNRKNIAVCRVTARITIGILQHLYLHAAMKRLPLRRISISPNKDTRIPTRLKMPPFHLEDEVFVHSRCPQFPDRFAGTMNHTILYRPGFWPAIHIVPTLQILTVKQRLEPAFSGW